MHLCLLLCVFKGANGGGTFWEKSRKKLTQAVTSGRETVRAGGEMLLAVGFCLGFHIALIFESYEVSCVESKESKILLKELKYA